MHIRIFDRSRNAVTQQREQSVIDPGKIDIDRFDIARAGRRSVQILNNEIGEDAAFDLEFEF